MNNAEQFCYWLQGMFELNPPKEGLTQTQVEIINDHLKRVFKKVTPIREHKKRPVTIEPNPMRVRDNDWYKTPPLPARDTLYC